MRLTLIWIGLVAVVAGCTNNSRPASADLLPSGVTAAFTAEHPYAKVHDAKIQTDKDGVERYVVPYTRPDGTEGTATYTEAGVQLDDRK